MTFSYLLIRKQFTSNSQPTLAPLCTVRAENAQRFTFRARWPAGGSKGLPRHSWLNASRLSLVRQRLGICEAPCGVIQCEQFIIEMMAHNLNSMHNRIDMSNSPQDVPGEHQPLVSVVMVMRNVDRYLAEAVDSILDQTFKDFEFIILDFGSTDLSKEIAADYAARDARVILHEIPTCGLAEARNAGCSFARGRYIAVQDADDISLPERLRCQVEFMEKHADVGVLGGAAQWVDAEGRPLWILNFPIEDHEIRAALATKCPFMHTSVLMRRDTFVAVHGYRRPFTTSQDYDLWLRISEHCQCANLAQVLVKYRLHPHQASISKRKHQTHCAIAARVSAAIRKTGGPDPLDSVETITRNSWLVCTCPPPSCKLASSGITETGSKICSRLRNTQLPFR